MVVPSRADAPFGGSLARVLRVLRALRPAGGELGYGLASRADEDGAGCDPEERRLADRMTPRRATDFLLGRCALRRALTDAGLPPPAGPILPGERGAPRLPSVAASVSHSAGIAVALAGSALRFGGVGVDLEFSNPPADAAHLVLTEPERAWLSDARAGAGRRYRLLAAFSAKEAVYKALDPVLSVITLRAIHLIPATDGFLAWPGGRRDLRLRVFAQPVGTGVLTWTTLAAEPSTRPRGRN